MMRHYNLDQSGFIVCDYATEQPGKDLVLLEEPDGSLKQPRWAGDRWEEGLSIEDERERMVLTQYQARAALLNAGLLDDVEALMDDPEPPREIALMWQHRERIRRTHSAVVQMARALGWTDEQVDDLFRAGMEIEP